MVCVYLTSAILDSHMIGCSCFHEKSNITVTQNGMNMARKDVRITESLRVKIGKAIVARLYHILKTKFCFQIIRNRLRYINTLWKHPILRFVYMTVWVFGC